MSYSKAYVSNMSPEELAESRERHQKIDELNTWFAHVGTFRDQLLRVLKSPSAPQEHQQLATEIIDWIEVRVEALVARGREGDFARRWIAELDAFSVWHGDAKLANPKADGRDKAIEALPQRDPNAPGLRWREYLEEEFRLKGLPSPYTPEVAAKLLERWEER